MEDWLRDLRSTFTAVAPDLLDLFDTYAAEARFGRHYIAGDLAQLDPSAHVLEVGAGSLLLSCQLAREGFQVTALEPVGDGFSHFTRMRTIVAEHARQQGCCPRILDVPGERLAERDRFDFAFSINVMEHVRDPEQVLVNVGRSLASGASYRFTCPNYLFPYEPHFNMPTLVSRRATELLLHRRIHGSQRVVDPAGMWSSLNWITVPRVRCAIERMPGFGATFNKRILVTTLERVTTDGDFAARRGPWVQAWLQWLVRSRMHILFGAVPAVLQPVMDCTMRKHPAVL